MQHRRVQKLSHTEVDSGRIAKDAVARGPEVHPAVIPIAYLHLLTSPGESFFRTEIACSDHFCPTLSFTLLGNFAN